MRIDATDLPEGALDAAAAFHARILPSIRGAVGNDLVILFAQADHTHREWRRAAIGELAREAAPARVNGVAGSHTGAMAQICEWLANAPGVTGQLLEAEITA